MLCMQSGTDTDGNGSSPRALRLSQNISTQLSGRDRKKAKTSNAHMWRVRKVKMHHV